MVTLRAVPLLTLCIAAVYEAAKTEDLIVETFCWKGGQELHRSVQVLSDDDDEEGSERRLSSQDKASESFAPDGSILDAIWDRPAWRQERFEFKIQSGEHPCFAGFASMLRDTNRCNGWRRQYPPVGDNVTFINTGLSRYMSFQLAALVGEHINVWLEEGSTDVHREVAVKAAQIYTNVLDVDELKPVHSSNSWMEQECSVMGQMPFMYSCSDRINVLVQNCGGVENAWVRPSDYLVNFPGPADNTSGPNNDIIFYMCQELLDRNPNPYAAANTFAHELAHVIQGGFGNSFYPMTEGGATWLEGSLLRLAPRPMQYAWGFRDWNFINAAHLYATTKDLNARKFYQIHAMFLTYLSQDELLGDAATSALQNYEAFAGSYVPWGRSAYDYFLSYVGKGKPTEFKPVDLDTTSVNFPFATALLDFRVAMAAQCIVNLSLRPSEAKYLMPAHLRDRPFWDCSTFPTYWSADPGSGVDRASIRMHYGGAAIFRLANPQNCTVSVASDADKQVRTKVLAAGTASSPAEIQELRPGESASFNEPRELFVVQVNVDPEGESISSADMTKVWRRTSEGCRKGCRGQAWTTSGPFGTYPNMVTSSLRSPLVELPNAGNITFSFMARWQLEDLDGSSDQIGGCPLKGYDGVQVRLHIYTSSTQSSDHADGDDVFVLQPKSGYGKSPSNGTAIAALATSAALKAFGEKFSCAQIDGWTGRSPGKGFSRQAFDLAPYAGSTIRVEVVFASDGNVAQKGFSMNGLKIQADGNELTVRARDGGQTGFLDEAMNPHHLLETVKAGSTSKDAGIPVVVQYADGYEPDRHLSKAGITRSAPWSASWDPMVADPLRAYLGWSYSADTYHTVTAKLHPWQEACVQLEAPFTGVPHTATLFSLVDKIGVGAVILQGRSALPPHESLGAEVRSQSPGVTDPGVHRFHLNTSNVPVLEAGQKFLICIGAGEVKELPYDVKGKDSAMLHLPLTNVSTAAVADRAGWTVLRELPDKTENVTDPWAGHTLSLRVEFIEHRAARRLRGSKLLVV